MTAGSGVATLIVATPPTAPLAASTLKAIVVMDTVALATSIASRSEQLPAVASVHSPRLVAAE